MIRRWWKRFNAERRITQNALTGRYRVEVKTFDGFDSWSWGVVARYPDPHNKYAWTPWAETEFDTLAQAEARLQLQEWYENEHELSKTWKAVRYV